MEMWGTVGSSGEEPALGWKEARRHRAGPTPGRVYGAGPLSRALGCVNTFSGMGFGVSFWRRVDPNKESGLQCRSQPGCREFLASCEWRDVASVA